MTLMCHACDSKMYVKKMCNHISDLGFGQNTETLSQIICSSAVILIYNWTAKSDNIASVPSSLNYVVHTGKISR